MAQLRGKPCANDNAPLKRPSHKGEYVPTIPQAINVAPQKTPFTPKEIPSRKMGSVIAWITVLLSILAGGLALWENIPLNDLYWPSLIFGTLLTVIAIGSKTQPQLCNISSLLIIGAFTLTIASYLSMNGFSLLGVELLIIISTLSILAGWAFQSNSSALLSALSCILYLSSLFPEIGILKGISEDISHLGAGLIPWLILGQILLGQHLKSRVVLLTAIIGGYIWLVSSINNMPLEHMAGLGFVIAAAHYSFGKSRVENGILGANIHRLCAWFVAIGTLLFIQSLWLNTEAVPAQPYESPSLTWWAILGAAMFVFFVISLQRYKESYISLFGVFTICTATLALPAAAAQPDLVYTAFSFVPGLNAQPGLGFIIGAIIIAAGFYWLIGGLKSGRILDMTMGALVIGIEVMMLFNPEKFNVDLGVIFVVSLICTLCVGGLIAGATKEPSQMADNYA